ncbi:MAG: gamma carbonic anhydrase family protein [Spirochaetia bacterium]|nr:gamma carbonic anhydrase family protein [Spirochaetia bacterium]
MIIPFKDKLPSVDKAIYIAPSADIIGDVTLFDNTSIWPHVTIRGDMASITIMENTNVQDNTVIHVNTNMPTLIGRDVTIGHSAILHACTIKDHVLVGMGAIILNEAVIGEYSLVAAGSVVPPGKVFPPKSLIMGNPAKVVRELREQEMVDIQNNCNHYIELATIYHNQ